MDIPFGNRLQAKDKPYNKINSITFYENVCCKENKNELLDNEKYTILFVILQSKLESLCRHRGLKL